jgi:lysophospholipase L1-like esterase
VGVSCFAAIGDSFTAGAGPGSPRWADDIARSLPGCRYVNLAVAGATSEEVLAGQLERALAAEPDLVSAICGANDVILTTRPDIEGFEQNFDAILGRIRERLPEARIVTATYPGTPDFLLLRPRSRARVTRGLELVNEVVRGLSRRHGAACFDFAAHPGRGERENFADDGFHPSEAGNRRAARAFARGLREQLGINLEEATA